MFEACNVIAVLRRKLVCACKLLCVEFHQSKYIGSANNRGRGIFKFTHFISLSVKLHLRDERMNGRTKRRISSSVRPSVRPFVSLTEFDTNSSHEVAYTTNTVT